MKFLILALCVCAASAASFGASASYGGYKGYQGYNKKPVNPKPVPVVPAPVAPVPVAAKAVAAVAAPVVVPVAAAASATYQAGAATYQAAKQVINKGVSEEGQAAILRADSETSPDGFRFSYETGNGISAEAVGVTKQVGDSAVVVSQGNYRYISPDGTPVYVTYTADENGFHPEGDVLPVAPAIPEAILRAIAYNAAHATKETVQY